ncbi:MAG: DUF2341 domain-containing protein [Candidatus Doudnabacteria bacterium]|nr:DUF2341 domain-containing protein [Candidatus Doudnabacteria bacterium]
MPGIEPEKLDNASSNSAFSWAFFDKKLNKYKATKVSQTSNTLKVVGGFLLRIPKFVINWLKVYEPRWRTILAIFVLFVLVTTILFAGSKFSQAASYTFVQTDWSGGTSATTATHPGNQTGWDKYTSQTNIDTGTAGALKTATATTTFPETFTSTTYKDAGNTTASWTTSGELNVTGDWCNISSTACNTSWLNRKKITFDNSASTEDLVNFAVLVQLSSANIDYTKTQNAGQDIRFVDTDGTTALNYEIESWNESGTSYVWVKVPQIDLGSTTDYIWMYYNNVSAVDNQNKTAVWDANYLGVYHLKEDPTGSAPAIKDSTSNANNLNMSGSMGSGTQISGQINGSLNFDGSDDALAQPSDNGMGQGIAALTVSAWFKPSVGTSLSDRGVLCWVPITASSTACLRIVRSNASGTLVFEVRNASNTLAGADSNSTFNSTAWNFAAGVYNGANALLYFNNTLQTDQPALTGNTLNNAGQFAIDLYSNSLSNFAGQIDEVRVSNIARSAEWLEAQYLFSLDSSKYTYATEESQTASGVAQSLTVDTVGYNIISATLTKNDTVGGGTLTYYLSNDGGSTFNQVTPASLYTFSTTGSDLRFKVSITGNATVQDVSIDYTGYNSTANLISSAYNSGDSGNLITKVAWNAVGTSGTETVKIQIRTAPDSSGSPGTWSSWCGYSDCSGSTYFTSSDNNVTIGSSHTLRTGANDQWFEYRVELASSGSATATFQDITINYVVNVAPQFDANYPTAAAGGSSSSQITDSSSYDFGKVTINYRIRDTDTTSGTTNAGFVTPSFEYNVGGGWISIGSGFLAASDLNNKAVDESNYTTYSATWNAPSQISNTYTTTAQVRVTVNDNEAANNTAQATTANFTLDTKVPTLSAFTVNGAVGTLTLTASDDTNLQYLLSNNADYSADGVNGISGVYQSAGGNSINLTPAWTLGGTRTVYVKVRDSAGNITTGSAVAPAALTNLEIKDISNSTGETYREFVSWTPYTSATGATFSRYEVYRSTDGSSFTSLSNISDINTNYVADFNLTVDTTYYYKVRVLDTDGDLSSYSSTVSDSPDGQGGTDAIAPTITTVTVAETQATYARITWTTDELSDTRVDYSISPSTTFGSGQTHSSFVTSHTITLTGLTPNTTYLFRAKSADVIGNTGTNDNGGAGFNFTTSSGPVISNVTETSVNDSAATIFWITDTDSDSHVTYSTSPTLASPTTTGSNTLVGGTNPYQHSVTISSLSAGTTYYYYVSSTDGGNNTSMDKNGGNYYSFRTTTDTVAPVISNISTPVTAPTAGVIVWETNELATTQAIWSATSGNLNNQTTLDSTLSIFHIVTLSALAEDTEYFFQVKSQDSAGNETVSAESSFTTGSTTVITQIVAGGGGGSNVTLDTTPPNISSVAVASVSAFTAQISFTTDEDSYGLVEYGTEANNLVQSSAVLDYGKSQNIKLAGLKMGTKYFFRPKAIDKAGNVTSGTTDNFETKFFTESTIKLDDAEAFQKEIEDAIESALPSLVPPFISSPKVSDITDTAATVTWKTNIKTYSVVAIAEENDYKKGETNPYVTEVSDTTNKVTDHEIVLPNLKPNTLYHLQIRSFSLPRLVGQSSDITFVTKALNIQAQINEITNNSFRVAWRTADPTSSVVEYRDTKTGVLNQKTIDEKATSHDIRVDGLAPANTYEVSVFGFNSKGNKVETASAVRITTSRDVAAPEIVSLKIDTAIVPGRTDRTQTIISWKTNEPSTSTVYFEEGAGTSADQKTLTNKVEITNSYVLDHAVVISVLKPGGLYRIQVASTDTAGNVTTLPIKTIVVPRQSESILDVVFKNFEDTFKFLRQIGK